MWKKLISGVLSFVLLSSLLVSGISTSVFADTTKNSNATTVETDKKKDEKKDKKEDEKKADKKDYENMAKKLDETVYLSNDLGANYTKKETTFKVWSPTAKLIKVKIYEKGSEKEKGDKVISTHTMEYDKKTGVWKTTAKGDLKNKYYTYVVYNENEYYETVDIYAKAVGVNGNRAMIVDLGSTNPEGWSDDKYAFNKNQTEAIIWEIQIKDFSYSETSGISEENRGKYLAFTEKGTTLNGEEGAASTGIDYLKELGVTHVQINPFYDFASIDEKGSNNQYNWGYDPKNYNAPEGSFSSNPYDGNVRINECKQMIKALHDAGIGVIMDVVYNHTYEGENSWFNKIVPNYYYRINSDGTWSNGSGCGNDTASERTMFRKFMVDSVTYWAEEYHIDGFRFDLMGLHDVETMNEIRKSLDNVKFGEKIIMYGEAWDLDTNADQGTVLATQNNMAELDNRIAAFNDSIRDGLRGSVFNISDKGFLQEGKNRSQIRDGIKGQADPTTGWAKTPSQTVTYSSCHDNNTLYDKLVGSLYTKDRDYYGRHHDVIEMNKLNGAIILTSQGASFMMAGEEFARSKNGDENSYKSSPEINQIDWRNLNQFSDLKEYYKGLIKIRKAFAPFMDNTNKSMETIEFFEKTDKKTIGYSIENKLSNEGWQKMAVIFNGDSEKSAKVKIDKPKDVSKWVIVANDKTSGYRNLGEVSGKGTVTVPPSSAVILVDKASYKNTNIEEKEGTVIAEFYDTTSKTVVDTQVLTGEIGQKYTIKTSTYFDLNYDITSVSGKETGKFKDGITKVSYKCKKYDGKISKVTIKFVDSETEEPLSNDIVMSNREGQEYCTTNILSFNKYSLDIENLPKNLSGTFGKEDKTVIYKYNKSKTPEKDKCLVNIFYVDNKGNILDKEALMGTAGDGYNVDIKEYEKLTFIESLSSSKLSGEFNTTEKNIILNYVSPDSLKENSKRNPTIAILSIVVLVLAAGVVTGSIIISKKKGKKKSIQIDNDDLYIDD